MFLIAGPCVIESKELLDEVASELKSVSSELGIEAYFKSSYKKANRTSAGSFTGVGDEKALSWLTETGLRYGLPTLTDVHEKAEVDLAANFVDVLQIPAFLARQTELLVAAGESGKIVNIKKGQFMSPYDMEKAAQKVTGTGNDKVWLTERGTFFGYNNLVVDFRSLVIMRGFGHPVVYDATHSVQQPSIGEQSGGQPQFIPALARAAVAVGIDGLFIETHPDPKNAKSDSATQLPLKELKRLLQELLALDKN